MGGGQERIGGGSEEFLARVEGGRKGSFGADPSDSEEGQDMVQEPQGSKIIAHGGLEDRSQIQARGRGDGDPEGQERGSIPLNGSGRGEGKEGLGPKMPQDDGIRGKDGGGHKGMEPGPSILLGPAGVSNRARKVLGVREVAQQGDVLHSGQVEQQRCQLIKPGRWWGHGGRVWGG